MKIKSFLIILTLILSLLLSGCSVYTAPDFVGVDVPATDEGISGAVKSDVTTTLAAASDLTIDEYTTFLKTKAEHYPISDEFIEKYQQNDGGYIDLAKQLGIPVDRQIHSPNQKWHFFESWFNPKLEAGGFALTDSARSKIYTPLLCPELLLWMYEASGIDPDKIKAAYDIAVDYKENGGNLSTTASKMRDCVQWADIVAHVTGNIVPATDVTVTENAISLDIGGTIDISAAASPSGATEAPIYTVISGKDVIKIEKNDNGTRKITALKEGTATVRVWCNSNVFKDCVVTVEDVIKIIDLKDSVRLDLGETTTLTPALNKEQTEFTFVSANEGVATVSSSGVITPIAYGETTITVTALSYPELTKTVRVVVAEKSSAAATYDISFTLSGKTAQLFEDGDATANEQAFATFVLSGGDSILTSVSGTTYIYGGGRGGQGDNLWYTGDMIKFGTTSVNGSITLNFNCQVNYIKITGYTTNESAKLQIGDAEVFTCSGMTIANKTNVESTTEPITTDAIVFTSTDSLTISTTNKKPIYITAIEVGYNADYEA